MIETWKEINNTEGKYSVSDFGSVRNNQTNQILKGSHVGKSKKRDRIPYRCFGLMIGKERKFFLAHRIVSEYFIPNPNNLPQVNHKDKDVTNNHVSNLEWINNKDNSRHANLQWIVQKDMSGNVIKTYRGLFEVGDSGFNKGHVCSVLKGRKKSCNGFRFEYGFSLKGIMS